VGGKITCMAPIIYQRGEDQLARWCGWGLDFFGVGALVGHVTVKLVLPRTVNSSTWKIVSICHCSVVLVIDIFDILLIGKSCVSLICVVIKICSRLK